MKRGEDKYKFWINIVSGYALRGELHVEEELQLEK